MLKHLGLFVCLLFFSADAFSSQAILWNQPEVIPEKLARNNRRVLRLTGTTTPGMQIRIRDNKVKMIFNKSRVRWARIPQKHRVQFPLIASDTGYFSFELYLPTTAVEVPIEIYRNGKWIPYRFSFDVPQEGAAEDFKFVEESFKVRKDEDNVKVEDFLSEYDKTEDVGQVVNDRGEWKSWSTGKVMVWGSLGFMYYSLEQESSSGPTPVVGDDLGTFGGVSFPAWEIGGEWRWNPQWKVDLAYMNRAGEAEEDGAYTMQNTNFNWTEFRANATYYPVSFEKPTYRYGFKGGLHFHDVPYVKRVGASQYRVFNNNMTFLAAGVNFETMRVKEWNFDGSAMVIYPVVVDDDFDLDSGYGLNLTVSIMKELIPALSIGGKIDMHWLNMEFNHPEESLPTNKVTTDMTLWHITPSFILKAEF